MSAPANQPPFSKRVEYALHAGVLFFFLRLSRLLGIERASALGAILGRRLAGPLLRRPRTYQNIGYAFPELSHAEATTLIDGMGENLGRTIAELAQFDRLGSHIKVEGREHIDAARSLGKPLLVVSGHFANWEALLLGLNRAGLQCAAMARPPNNPWVARWIAKNRAMGGLRDQFAKGPEGTRQMLSDIRKGGDIVLLIDQNLAEGVPVPLFGRPALTASTPAALAVKGMVTVLPVALLRDTGCDSTFRCSLPLLPAGPGNNEADILAMMGEINRFIEARIRERPAHWLWMHDRWKPAPGLSRRAKRVLGSGAD